MKDFNDIGARWMEDPAFRAEYDALAPEWELPMKLVAARRASGLTQGQIAERMGTKQSAVARLEGGTGDPKMSTLRAFAEATGTELVIEFRGKAEAGKGTAA